MPIVEFVRWIVTEEYLTDLHSRMKTILTYIQDADGCISVHLGIEKEDSNIAWMVVVWEAIEHHHIMMKRPDYPDIMTTVRPLLRDGQMQIYHVNFNNETTVALTASTTRISIVTMTETQNAEDLSVLLKTVGNALDHPQDGHAPIAWGETEEPGKYIYVVGCQDHDASSKLRVAPVEELPKAVVVQTIHVRLSKLE